MIIQHTKNVLKKAKSTSKTEIIATAYDLNDPKTLHDVHLKNHLQGPRNHLN